MNRNELIIFLDEALTGDDADILVKNISGVIEKFTGYPTNYFWISNFDDPKSIKATIYEDEKDENEEEHEDNDR